MKTINQSKYLCAAITSFILSLLAGCQYVMNPISQEGRRVCQQEAAGLILNTEVAREKMSSCLQSIDQRLQKERERKLGESLAEKHRQDLEKPSIASVETQYIFCMTHQEDIKLANDRLSAALGRWMHANASLKPGDLAYDEAKKEYEDAYAAFEMAIPVSMRGGRPLLPDAAQIFMNCDRKDFVKSQP